MTDSWLSVDVDYQYWVELPVGEDWRQTSWGSEKNWGRSAASTLLSFNDLPEKRGDVRELAKALMAYRYAFEESGPGREHYLYFSEPKAEPFSMHLWYGPAEGEREAALRTHVRADGTDTMLPPKVDEFTSNKLGPGLRSLNHVLLADGSVSVNLWYALRDDKRGLDVIAFSSSGDLGRFAAAFPAFDAFVDGISFFDDDDQVLSGVEEDT